MNDNGNGIDPQRRKRLFMSLYRALWPAVVRACGNPREPGEPSVEVSGGPAVPGPLRDRSAGKVPPPLYTEGGGR